LSTKCAFGSILSTLHILYPAKENVTYSINTTGEIGTIKYSVQDLTALEVSSLNLHGVSKKSRMRDQNQSEQYAHQLGAKYFLVSDHGI
jgi:hypothetical protein